MSAFCVYLHKRPDGSPFYVGKGTLERSRKVLRRNNPHHRNIVAKYGRDNIIIEIVATDLAESAAFALETETITSMRAAGERLCNLSDGGEGPSNPSAATRRRMSKAQRKREYTAEFAETMRRAQMGRKHTEETKKKIGEAHKGKMVSEETKRKLQEINLGKPQSPEAREKNRLAQFGNKHALGNKLSPATRELMSAARKGRPWSAKRREAYEAGR